MPTLPERIAAFYEAINQGPSVMSLVDGLYAENTRYTDPLQDVSGRDGVKGSFEKMFKKYKVKISDVRAVGGEDLAMATWEMDLTPRIGPTFKIHGASDFAAEGGLVVLQRDYWDLLGTAMATLPWVDDVYKRIVNELFL